jgi:DNA-binding IscR family transcriptional regulator
VQLLDGEFDAEAAAAGGANEVWSRAVTSLRNELSGTTIADVVAQEAQAAGAQMYQI